MTNEFPNDDDGDVLRSLLRQGVDLGQPRVIEFYCYADSRSVADMIAARLDEMGFKSDVFEDDESESEAERISVYSAICMIPNYDDIVRIQAELNEVLLPFGTHCDGWGTLVDPENRIKK